MTARSMNTALTTKRARPARRRGRAREMRSGFEETASVRRAGPAVTPSPANAFTPSRLLLLSRPLRDEPMPFLCAIAFLHLRQGDLLDAKLGEVLPVALLPAVVRLRLV